MTPCRSSSTALEKWASATGSSGALLAGRPTTPRAAETRAGKLPPGSARDAVSSTRSAPIAEAIAAAVARRRRRLHADRVDVDGRARRRSPLGGTVAGVGGTWSARSCTRASQPEHRLGAWVRLLALTRPSRACVRGGDDRPRARARRRATVMVAASRRSRRPGDAPRSSPRGPPDACRPAATAAARAAAARGRRRRPTRAPRATASGARRRGSGSRFEPDGEDKRARAPARLRRRVAFDELLAEPPARGRGRRGLGRRRDDALRPLRAAAVGLRCSRTRR